MKSVAAATLVFALSVGVSSLAFATSSDLFGAELTFPPAAVPKYVPSVPARDVPVIEPEGIDSDADYGEKPYISSYSSTGAEEKSVDDTASTSTPKKSYVPSVPERKIEEAAPAVEAQSTVPSIPSVAEDDSTSVPAARTSYVPSVPERKIEEAAPAVEARPAVPLIPSLATDDAVSASTPKTSYVPSVPERKIEEAAPAQEAQPEVPSVPSVAADDSASEPAVRTSYVPSVPERKTEEATSAVDAQPTIVMDSSGAEMKTSSESVATPAATTAYVPSVPEPNGAEAQPVTPPAIPSLSTDSSGAEVQTSAPASLISPPSPTVSYAPSVPVAGVEGQEIAEPVRTEEDQKAAADESNVVEQPVDGIATVPAGDDLQASQDIGGMYDALAKAYNFNPELKSFRSRLKSVDEQIPQAYAGWLPTATANYSYGYEKQKSGNTQLNGNHPETKSLSVVQPIFNGGETLARTSRAFNAVTVGRAQLTDAEQQVLSDAVKAYMDVVRNSEILDLSTHNEQVLSEQLIATKDRFSLGETTRTDVAQSEARLARATSDKVRAAGNLDVAKANYLRVIGEPPVAVQMPKILPAIPSTLDESLAIGMKKNPQLIAADVARSIADDDVDILESAVLPDVSLRGTMSRQDGLSSRSGFSFDDDSVTINATIPIFQSGAEYSRVRQSKRTRQQRVEEYDSTHDKTVENITSRWRDIETARASIVSNKSAVESATIALNGVRQEADVGTRTTLDVLDAEQELFVAKVNLVTAQAQEVIAIYAFRAAIGSLTAQDLALNVQVYDPTEHEKSVKYRIIGF